jgi:hypothetical protein
MATFECIAATARSFVRLVNAAFDELNPLPEGSPTPRAVLIRSDDLEAPDDEVGGITSPGLSILLYRVEVNKTVRSGWSAVGSANGRAHLPLDLHFLVTPWASNADYELRILGRTMQCMEEHPSLSGPLLDGAGWAPGDSVQLVLDEVSTETVMRTFDSLPHDFKLSVTYVARVVRLDSLRTAPPRDVEEVVRGIRAEVP